MCNQLVILARYLIYYHPRKKKKITNKNLVPVFWKKNGWRKKSVLSKTSNIMYFIFVHIGHKDVLFCISKKNLVGKNIYFQPKIDYNGDFFLVPDS